jgi:hypothetical protein
MVLALGTLLAGCGGESVPQAKAPVAVHEFAAADLPALNTCLAQIAEALQKDPSQRAVGLSCLRGNLRGLLADGNACALTVDAEASGFRFDYGRESVNIRWQDVSFPPGARPIHNLEYAGMPRRPGIQLTRFTGGLAPLTEAITIRAGTASNGAAALPAISYQRILQQPQNGSQLTLVECRFGK